LQSTLDGVTQGVPVAAQDAKDTNIGGIHLWWEPVSSLHFMSEFAHSPSGYGYWMETAYRIGDPNKPRWYNGFEPLFRMQQFYRTSFHRGDELPGTDVQQADFGLNYYLPKSVRLNANYSRRFASTGDQNIWNFAVTYRFMLPLGKGGS